MDIIKSIWILVAVAALVSGSPQSRGIALSFPGEFGAGPDYGGLEEFYDNQDAKIWLPDNPDNNESPSDFYGDPDNFYGNPDNFYGNPDDSYDNTYVNPENSYHVGSDYDDDVPGPVLEPTTFVSEADYLELPEWMDVDFNEIPLDKLQLLNNVSELADLAAFFDLDQKNADKLSMLQSNGRQVESRSSGFVDTNYESPVFARCEPERVKVVLEAPVNSNYLPSCVRLMRCGGCCNNDKLLSCQPTKSEIKTLKVLKITKNKRSTRRRGRARGRRNSGNLEKIEQENHLECSCQCKVQEHHCKHSLHNYNKNACACICKDQRKKSACLRNSSHQRWDNDNCSCMCHTTKQCGNGEFFSQNTCTCEQVPRISAGGA